MTAPVQQRINRFTCRLGRPLSYIEAGAGPDIVIVNAYGVSTQLWKPVVERLGRSHRVLLWDMRGFADGERDLRFKLADHAADLLEILDHAGASKPHLLAYCSGTKVALTAYERLRDKVQSLVFVGGNFWPMADYGPMRGRFATNLYNLAQMVEKRPFMAPVVVTMKRGNIIAHPSVKENMNLIPEEYRDLVVGPFTSKEAVRTYAGLVMDYYSVDTTPKLDALSAPTLVIGAKADTVVDPGLSTAAAARIHGAEFVGVEDFNHFCMVEAPDRLADLVAGFFDRIEADRGPLPAGSLDAGIAPLAQRAFEATSEAKAAR
jgi:pimeloyl-ACP methyl ester carboxylesterase